MNVNRGKQFENVIRDAFHDVPNTCVIRLHDQTTGYAGSKNPCDFIVYKYPFQYCLELKSVHGNTFPFSNITDFQYKQLLDISLVRGVEAGILCWWVDRDVTKYIPIATVKNLIYSNHKSIRFDSQCGIMIHGEKKKVFFKYDMARFFREVEDEYHSVSG